MGGFSERVRDYGSIVVKQVWKKSVTENLNSVQPPGGQGLRMNIRGTNHDRSRVDPATLFAEKESCRNPKAE